jgi:hypothetical protein
MSYKTGQSRKVKRLEAQVFTLECTARDFSRRNDHLHKIIKDLTLNNNNLTDDVKFLKKQIKKAKRWYQILIWL